MNPISANGINTQLNAANPLLGGMGTQTTNAAGGQGQGLTQLKDALKKMDPNALKQALGPQMTDMLTQMLQDPQLRQQLVQRFGEQNVQKLEQLVNGLQNGAAGQGGAVQNAAPQPTTQAAAPCNGAGKQAAPQAAAPDQAGNGGQDAGDKANGIMDFIKPLLDGLKKLFQGAGSGGGGGGGDKGGGKCQAAANACGGGGGGAPDAGAA